MVLSRRTFSALAGTTALGLSLGGCDGAFAHTTAPTGPAPGPPAADGTRHTVGFDKYSMLVDGRRAVLWSGEVHPFRLPSPSLWRDVLEKLRAHGYNTISVYVSWNYHSPAPGHYDFTGVRDLDLFLRTAAETGLFVILRPGPYINAEVDAGGFPGWLTATRGTARTSDPTYLSYVDEWLTAVNRIAARHLYTHGGGTIVLYQLENEYANNVTSPRGRDYMAHLYAKVRADGIDVPLFHNDKGRNGYWAPGTFDTGGETGRYLYGFDGYPSPFAPPPDWGYYGIGGTKGGSTASPDTPGLLAEFGGGWFDPWGGVEFDGKGYAESARTRDAAYERRFYLTNLANGIKVHNVYMTFGGPPGAGCPRRSSTPRTTTGPPSTRPAGPPRSWSRCTSSGSSCTPCPNSPSWTGRPTSRSARAAARRGRTPGSRRTTWSTRTPRRTSTSCATTGPTTSSPPSPSPG